MLGFFMPRLWDVVGAEKLAMGKELQNGDREDNG